MCFISNKFSGMEFLKFIFKLTSLFESRVIIPQFRADRLCYVIFTVGIPVVFILSLWINTCGISLHPGDIWVPSLPVYFSCSCSRRWLPFPLRCTKTAWVWSSQTYTLQVEQKSFCWFSSGVPTNSDRNIILGS